MWAENPNLKMLLNEQDYLFGNLTPPWCAQQLPDSSSTFQQENAQHPLTMFKFP